MIPWKQIDQRLSGFGQYLQEGYMEHLGIANSRRISKLYNHFRYAKRRREHERAYRHRFAELLEENRRLTGEAPTETPIRIEDGYFIDRSKTLPHLDHLLEETGKIIERRGGREHSDIQRPYFRNLLFPADAQENRSFMNFATSSAMLQTVSEHMGGIPVMSFTRPPGLRMMESNKNLDDRINPPLEASQLFHLDLHDTQMVYVVVLLEDVTMECGPWSFLPASTSSHAQWCMGYQKRGRPYRIPDAEMYRHVDEKDLIVFTGKRGDVLFIDSSRCFHYGSREAVKPRYLMMYGFTTPCRADMTLTYLNPYPFPTTPEDSPLKQLVSRPLD